MDEYPYKVIDSNGNPVLQASESCRYPKQIELDLMTAGYAIRLHGRKITKKELLERSALGNNQIRCNAGKARNRRDYA